MTESTFLKLIICGNGAVGKTTLLYRYIQGQFHSDTKMTLGVDFMLKEVKRGNREISLQIWDFGGQEHFRHILQRYALGSQGAIIMFDLTQINSLNNLDEWVSICRKFGPDLPIVLLGSKLDLVEDIQVEDDYVLELKENYNFLDYIKTSSKTGENVKKAFDILLEKILQNKD